MARVSMRSLPIEVRRQISRERTRQVVEMVADAFWSRGLSIPPRVWFALVRVSQLEERYQAKDIKGAKATSKKLVQIIMAQRELVQMSRGQIHSLMQTSNDLHSRLPVHADAVDAMKRLAAIQEKMNAATAAHRQIEAIGNFLDAIDNHRKFFGWKPSSPTQAGNYIAAGAETFYAKGCDHLTEWTPETDDQRYMVGKNLSAFQRQQAEKAMERVASQLQVPTTDWRPGFAIAEDAYAL